MNTDTATRSDLDALTALNSDYIHSVQHGDVKRFDESWLRISCARTLTGRSSTKPIPGTDRSTGHDQGPAVQNVKVRILGNVAIIHARTSYTTADGEQRNGRYTDVWARRDGRWLAVSAHVTR